MLSFSDFLALITAGAIVVSATVGENSLRHFTKIRESEVLRQMASTHSSPEATQNLFLLYRTNAKTFEEIKGKPEEIAMFQWDGVLEGLGLLVKRGVVPLDLVDDYFHGFIRRLWVKLEPFVQNYRIEYNHPEFGEWAEYLYNRIYRLHEVKQKSSSDLEEEIYSRRIANDKTREEEKEGP